MPNERLFTSPSAIGLRIGTNGQDVTNLQVFLRRFGYLRETRNSGFAAVRDLTVPDADAGTFDNATEEALRSYQQFHGLPITGELDRATVAEVQKPRCGFPDKPSTIGSGRFVAWGTRWDHTNITYRIINFTAELTQAEIRDAVRQALDLWGAVAPLTFTEVTGNADISISFVTGDHGDDDPFDGVGNVLAHAYYPPPNGGDIAGDAHFDDAETWTVNVPVPAGGWDLVTIAAHEFGHSLGLNHTNIANALMFPTFPSGSLHRFLVQDDIDGIQSIYGRRSIVTNALLGAVARKPGILDLFVVGNDGRVYTSWFVEGVSDWSGINDNWRSIGGFFPVGAPVSAVARKPGILDLFVVGNDGRVYTSWFVEGVSDWSGINDNWRSIGGFFPVGAPVSAVARKPGILDLFVVGNDGRVYTSWFVEGVSDWSGINDNWRSIGGFFPVGAPVSAVARKPGILDLFVVGNDGRVYTSWFVEGVSDWSGINDNWRSIGGFFPVGAPVSAVARKPGILDLFVVGNDGRVYTSWFVEGVSDWSGINDNWRSIGGFFPVGAPVSAVARKPGILDLFVVGNDGRVYTSWFVEGVSDWSGINDNWRSIGGFFPVGAPVIAVARKPEILDLFVVGNDGRVYTSWFVEGVSDWSGINDNWRSIGGFFPVPN